MTITWKACIAAHSCQSKQIERSALQLQQSGWEEFFVYVPRGTKAPDRADATICRPEGLTTRDEDIDYALTYEALDALTTGYMHNTTYFLVTSPGIYCWEQLQHYCESQIESNRFAAWCLGTPTNLFNSERARRPEAINGDGFYRVKTPDQVLSANTFVVTPATAKLLVTQLPKPAEKKFKTFAHAMGYLAHQMPGFELYYHLRSLVRRDGEDCPDFVGVNYVMPNSELNEPKPLNL